MRPLLTEVIDAAGALAGAFVFTIFFVMLAATVMRTLGMRTGGTDDVVSWMTAAAAFFGLAHAFRHGDFVRVTLLLESLGPRWRHVFELLSLAIATAFTGYIAWSITLYVMDNRTFGDMAGGWWSSRSSSWSSLAIGSFLLFVAVADQFVHVLRGNHVRLRGRRRRAPRPRRFQRGRMNVVEVGVPAHRDADAADRRRLDRDDPGPGRLGRHGAVHHAARGHLGQEPVLGHVGVERLMGTGGPAAVHLDGRDCSNKLSEQMFEGLAAPWLNRVPGRLIYATILGCGIFGSVSGSSAATCATIAKVALPKLVRRGYDERLAWARWPPRARWAS